MYDLLPAEFLSSLDYSIPGPWNPLLVTKKRDYSSGLPSFVISHSKKSFRLLLYTGRFNVHQHPIAQEIVTTYRPRKVSFRDFWFTMRTYAGLVSIVIG